MLVLSRKIGERIQIGDTVSVTVLEVRGGTVRLGFDGPASVPIHREEVYQRVQQETERGQRHPLTAWVDGHSESQRHNEFPTHKRVTRSA